MEGGKTGRVLYHALADLHTKFSGARPLRDPILSFSQIFSQKSVHVGCPRAPLQTGPRTPRENPGSAPVIGLISGPAMPKYAKYL